MYERYQKKSAQPCVEFNWGSTWAHAAPPPLDSEFISRWTGFFFCYKYLLKKVYLQKKLIPKIKIYLIIDDEMFTAHLNITLNQDKPVCRLQDCIF